MVDREKEIKEFTNDPNRLWTQTIEIELPASPKSISLEIEEPISDSTAAGKIHNELKVSYIFILFIEFAKETGPGLELESVW